MLGRVTEINQVERRLRSNPVVALLGARQVGKTTLAREIAERFNGPVTWFDLEDRADRARLSEPELALAELDGLVVLDEIQLVPEIFPVLRVLIDREPLRRFLILGSASPELLKQSSESLAGRVAFVSLKPFALRDVGDGWRDLWIRGGLPRSYLAEDDLESFEWRLDYASTFIARDLPMLGSMAPSPVHERFLAMVAALHGQLWNAEQVGGSIGLRGRDARRYLDLLTASFIVRQLRPWHANIAKRQVKRAKVYIADTGILHSLLGIRDRTALERHPMLGASWEWFVLRQIEAALEVRETDLWFWATHAGAELDLLVESNGERFGFEIKRTTAPKFTRSMRSALEALDLDRAFVVHGGQATFPLSDEVTAVSLADLGQVLDGLQEQRP